MNRRPQHKERSKFAPYDLVEVKIHDPHAQGDQRTFIGEVISYPIPNGKAPTTIMIRRVPCNPGTLEEVLLDDCSWPYNSYRWLHYAAVMPVTPLYRRFPSDMLRYDSCVPLNFTLDDDKPVLLDGHDKDSKLIVVDVSLRATAQWTKDRWSSFGWRCEHILTQSIEQAALRNL